MRHLLVAVPRLAGLGWLAVWLSIGADGVHAQPVPPELLPYVDQTGWIRGALHYSAVVARHGEPPVADVTSERIEHGKRRGGTLTLAYPALGLAFIVERGHRAAADPIVDSVRVTAPWVPNGIRNASSPPPQRAEDAPPAPRWIVAGTGLYVGMPVRELDALLARHHRIKHDFRGATGNGYLSLEDATWSGRRNVSIGIDRGRVSAVTFAATDLSRWHGARKLIGPLVMIVLALVAGTLWQRARRRMREAVALESTQQRSPGASRPAAAWAVAGRGLDAVQRNGQRIRSGAGILCLAAGAGLGWFAWSIVRASSDPYSRLGALIFGLGAAGAMVFALALFAGLRGSLLGLAARGILIVGLLAYILSKLFG